MSPRPPLLSPESQVRLERLGGRLTAGSPPAPEEVAVVLEDLGQLSPGAIAQAADEITNVARIGWWRPNNRPFRLADLFRPAPPPPLSEKQLMAADPSVAWLFLFHHNGHIREAALDDLSAAPVSPFLFAAIAWRLNDWAEPVRAAAKRCAARLFPLTAPDVAARAGLSLLDREFHWARWSHEREPLDAVFAHPDVAAQLAGILLADTTGPLATRLRHVLRYIGYDRHLPVLAQSAVQPAVRATALRVLIERRASWPVGFGWKWIDKTYGRRQRVVVTAARELTQALPLEPLILRGLQDPSPVVRRVAADALIKHQAAMPGLDSLIDKLARDRSPSLRERADYMIRHPVGG